MITSIRCENYRCFKDSGDVKIAPITILVGENNSGKSSFIQALLLPALSLDVEDKVTPLITQNKEYDFGSYGDLIYGHNEKDNMIFRYGVQITGVKNIKIVYLEIEYGFLVNRKEIYLYRFAIEVNNKKIVEICLNKYSGSVMKMSFFDYKEDLQIIKKLFGRVNYLWLPDQGPFFSFEKLTKKYGKQKTEKTEDILNKLGETYVIVSHIKESFEKIHHLGPLRLPAGRTIRYSGSSYLRKIGVRGESVLHNYSVLVKRGGKTDKELINKINTAMYRLGFIKQIEIHNAGPKYYEYWTQHGISQFKANLADTGFGASQAFPVIFSLATLEDGDMFLCEQPELHLHPSAQAEMGSILVQSMSPQKRIVIETHSESLILRLQTEIAKGRLNPEDIKVYYMSPCLNGHKIINLSLNDMGEFTEPWPKGFFEENFLESKKLSEARYQKTKKNTE